MFLKNLDLSKLQQKRKIRTGRKPLNPFPVKLYKMLMDLMLKGKDDIASWGPDGASFLVHDTERLVSEALPAYFNQTKYKSFQRQLNFYGFARIMDGPLEGSYCHPMFRRGQEEMCHRISRKEHQEHDVSSQPRTQIGPLDIVIPDRTPEEEEQEVQFFTAPKHPQQDYSRILPMQNTDFNLEPRPIEPSLLYQESIHTLPPRLSSQQSSMFMLPPGLIQQQSILANGHPAHNFGKSFFFVENDMGELFPQHAAV